MILAVDIGGTKVSVATFAESGGELLVERSAHFLSADYDGLSPLLAEFLQNEKPAVISVGVAGPVVAGRAEVTNLPWVVVADEVAKKFGCPVYLMNDLQAHGYGLDTAAPESLICLQTGKRQVGNRALIAAGTGLGECILFWDGKRHIPSPSEGGHAGFGPESAEDDALLTFLRERFERVSWERVVSGRDGFRNLLDFYAPRFGGADHELVMATEGEQDVGELVTAFAARKDPLGVRIMETFVRLYGVEAGNLALKALAVGGVYIGGGIAPKNLEWMRHPLFLEGFLSKGRFRDVMEGIPVSIVNDPWLALRGAATYALRCS